MTSASSDDLSPSSLLGLLWNLERAENDGQGTHLDSLIEAFDQRLRSLPSSEIMVLLAQAIDRPATEDERSYWCCICELHRRADPGVFETCAAWARAAE